MVIFLPEKKKKKSKAFYTRRPPCIDENEMENIKKNHHQEVQFYSSFSKDSINSDLGTLNCHKFKDVLRPHVDIGPWAS